MPYVDRGAALGRDLGLSGFWDDLYKVASGVATAASTVSQVKSGQSSIAVVPAGQASYVPASGGPFTVGVGVNWLYPALAVGGLLLVLALGKKRR
jgi:hypothetical protein